MDSYAALRNAILTGRFGPNERLVEAEISSEFAMPRAAVRTAFVRLEVEGLLRREPNKGARVRLVTDEEAIQIMHARAVLEGLIARRAAQRVTAADARRLVASARRFDLMLCNILARIIIQMCDQHLGEVIRPGGLGVFSGIIDTQADDVEAALRKTGLEPFNRLQQGDWVVIEARRPNNA